MNAATLAIDHPAWVAQPGGFRRAVRSGEGTWVLILDDDRLTVTCVNGSDDQPPDLTRTRPTELPPAAPAPLSHALHDAGVVCRLSNPWLWDALTAAILHQSVRAARARRLYQLWCATHGRVLAGVTAIPPDPQTVLALTDDELARAGGAFHAGALRAAATAYLEHHEVWKVAPAEELVEALLAVPQIGPSAALAAVADYCGDFSIHPRGDPAVRSMARRAAPDVRWPTTARAFERYWTSLAETPRQLHTLTVLTLTWGSRAPIARHPSRVAAAP